MRIVLLSVAVIGLIFSASCKSSIVPDITDPDIKIIFQKGNWSLLVTGTGFEDQIILNVIEGESSLLESSSSQCEIVSVNGKNVATNPVQSRTLNFWPEKKVDIDIAYVETKDIWPRYILTGTHSGTTATGTGTKHYDGKQFAVTFTMRKI